MMIRTSSFASSSSTRHRFGFAILACLLFSGVQAPASDVQSASSFQDCQQCPEMIEIAPGSFLMGSDSQEIEREGVSEIISAWERPQRVVTIEAPFAISVGDVTRKQFAAFIYETKHNTGDRCFIYQYETNDWGYRQGLNWSNPGFQQGDEEPVVCVNWYDAKMYVEWLARKTGKPYRLLTEAEWEYAARAGAETTRPWGNSRESICEYANVTDLTRRELHTLVEQSPNKMFQCRDGYIYTAPNDAFPDNAYGVKGLLGNVWSWTEDCFHDSYVGAPSDGSAWVDGGDCSFRIIKGGSWGSNPSDVRPAQRGRDPDIYRANYIGFRVAIGL